MRSLIGGAPRTRMLMLSLTAVLLLGSCTTDDETTTGATDEETATATVTQPATTATTTASPADNEITITATEYEFEMPDEIPAGPVTFVLQNAGEEPHEVGMVRLKANAPPVQELIKMSEKKSEKYIEEVGFIPTVKGGKTAKQELTTTLTAGRYGIACFVEAPDGKPHALHGMFHEFEVVGDAGPASTAPPEADVTVTGIEYAFRTPPALPAGQTTFAFVNQGQEKHEMAMAKLKEDAPPVQQLLKMPGGKARKHIEEVGFIPPTKPGEAARSLVSTNLTAGNYVMVCFLEAPDGKPHALKGMVAEFTVQ